MIRCIHCKSYFSIKDAIQVGRDSFLCIKHYIWRREYCSICHGAGHCWYKYFSLCVKCIHATGKHIPYWMADDDKDEELPASFLYRIRAFNQWGFDYYCKIVPTLEDARKRGMLLYTTYWQHSIHIEQEMIPTKFSFVEAIEKVYE